MTAHVFEVRGTAPTTSGRDLDRWENKTYDQRAKAGCSICGLPYNDDSHVKVDARIRLLEMPNDPDPIEAGATGTVRGITASPNGYWQVHVEWDVDRGLMLVMPGDVVEVMT